jgi:hypothetical protein
MIEVYRHESTTPKLVKTLQGHDKLTSSVLTGLAA